MKTSFAIVSTMVGGGVQWLGKAESPEHAMRLFDDDIGIWPDGSPEDIFDGYRVVELTEVEAAQVDKWLSDGSPASDCPTPIRG